MQVVSGHIISDDAAGSRAAILLLLCGRASVGGRKRCLLGEHAPAWPAISCGVGGPTLLPRARADMIQAMIQLLPALPAPIPQGSVKR